jgi:AcrR family transcriptional regulator
MGRHKTIEDVELLAAARKVFQETGHAASTRDIARAAGISQAVLYQRFASKDELFFRAMTPELPDLETFLGSYPPKDAFEDLFAIAERLLTFLRSFMPTLLKVLAFPGVDKKRLHNWHSQLPFLPIADALAERFRRLNADGVTTGDPHACAVAFMSTIHSLALFELLTTSHERTPRKANLRALTLVLWRGIEARPGGPSATFGSTKQRPGVARRSRGGTT